MDQIVPLRTKQLNRLHVEGKIKPKRKNPMTEITVKHTSKATDTDDVYSTLKDNLGDVTVQALTHDDEANAVDLEVPEVGILRMLKESGSVITKISIQPRLTVNLAITDDTLGDCQDLLRSVEIPNVGDVNLYNPLNSGKQNKAPGYLRQPLKTIMDQLNELVAEKTALIGNVDDLDGVINIIENSFNDTLHSVFYYANPLSDKGGLTLKFSGEDSLEEVEDKVINTSEIFQVLCYASCTQDDNNVKVSLNVVVSINPPFLYSTTDMFKVYKQFYNLMTNMHKGMNFPMRFATTLDVSNVRDSRVRELIESLVNIDEGDEQMQNANIQILSKSEVNNIGSDLDVLFTSFGGELAFVAGLE